MDSLVIKSYNNSSFLELSLFNKDYLIAKLSTKRLQAELNVYLYMSPSIAGFFGDLATNWNGWKGIKKWSSFEGELSIEASCDSTGHITFIINLSNGAPPYWQVQATITCSAGQLETFFSESKLFEAALSSL